ncbi:MAG: aminopeptidase [Betaproteobacteria bacterium]|nr:aminopeptidase [Betaproteobacteria bacterium]MDH5286073.1 aminopeptidase [Betaproteobacteria bacterium]
MRRALRNALLAPVVAALGGCGALDYYWQGAAGQFGLLAGARPVDEVMSTTADAKLAERLALAREIRAFASRELALPDNASYTRYADLGRPFVAWNVFAAPALSLEPRKWCFPVAGCVNYRGYFSEADAKAEAARLAAAGDDVHVAGVPAYSTLGWFDDPLLSSFVRYPDTALARLVFHELAHQVAYVRDDTTFNESFAAAVEEAGVARWIAARAGTDAHARLAAEQARADRLRGVFVQLVRDARAELAAVYASDAPEAVKQARKAAAFASMRAAYEAARAGEAGLAGYERWFAGHDGRGPNNASLASVALYDEKAPAFRALLARYGGDLPRFYAEVRYLAKRPKAERDAILGGTMPQ